MPHPHAAASCASSCSANGLCMPLFYLLGAAKGGTTSLAELVHRLGGAREHCGPTASAVATRTVAGYTYPRGLWYKESNFLINKSFWTPPLRQQLSPRLRFVSLHNISRCSSACFLEATAVNLVEPVAAHFAHAKDEQKIVRNDADAVNALSRRQHCGCRNERARRGSVDAEDVGRSDE